MGTVIRCGDTPHLRKGDTPFTEECPQRMNVPMSPKRSDRIGDIPRRGVSPYLNREDDGTVPVA